jgi:hypothetical protein
VDSDGHVTSVVNTAIAIDTSQIASGTLSTGRGGTGQTAASIVNGALLIGNTVSGGYDLNTITQGTGILVTNDKGTITIAAAASGSGNAFGVVNVSTPGQSNIVASGATTLILVPGTGIMMTTDATSNAITITSAGSVPFPKSVDILFPTTGDEITFFYTNTAITFSRVVSVVKGSAPNVVFSLSYANTRAPGTVGTAITGQVVCSNTTNGVYTTAFTNATVPANNYVFLDIVSSVGNETEFHVTMEIATVSTSFVDQYARDKANGSVQTGFVTVNVAGQLDVVADSNTDILTLVAGSGINITTDAPNDTITLATTTTLATPVNTTSGTSIDFTGIPAGTKKIFVMFSNVSTNSTSSLILQIGDSGGIRNTGYASIGTTIINGAVPGVLAYTTGFGLMGTTSTTDAAHWNGTVMLTLLDASAFTWTASGTICRTDVATTGICTGAKSLPATLDRLRITTVLGTQAFDAGSINIIYE